MSTTIPNRNTLLAGFSSADWESQRRRVTAVLLILPVVMMTLLFLVPLGYLLWLSFGGPAGFSLNAYKQLSAPFYINLALFTLQLAFLVTIACAVIAYPLAYMLANIENTLSRLVVL